MNCLKQLQKFFSGVLVVTFFVTNTLNPAPVAYAANVESSAFLSSFKIPAEFGKVTDSVKGPAGGPLIVHIQEAHANYDAQKNIQNILKYLAQDYGIREIFLEGAGYQLKPDLFKFFPEEPSLQQAVNEKLLQAGELTGTEVFLMDASQNVAGWGVEKAGAYAKNRQAFKKTFEGRTLAEHFLGAAFLQWQKTATLSPNKPLRDFLNRETSFEEKRLPLADWMDFLKAEAARHLKIDLADAREQKNWPVLVRYFRLKVLGNKIDQAKTGKEKEDFLQDLNARAIPAELIREIARIFEHKKDGDLPPYKTRFALEKLMDLLPADYSFEAYPNVRFLLQQGILLSELQGDALQTEINSLARKLTDFLVQTEADERLVTALSDYRLLKKLFQLELSREEYQQVLSREISPSRLTKEIGLIQSKENAASDTPHALEQLYGTAIQFYEGAIEREGSIMEKTLEQMREHKQTKAVLVTGGFHAEGLKEKAIKVGGSYIEITPRIGEISADSNKNYLQALLGKRAVENSQIAALARSDVRFLKEVSPKNWRRELAGVGARMSDVIAEEAGRVKAEKAIRDYLKAAISEIPQKAPVVSSVARSETREGFGLSELYSEIHEIAKGEADGFKLLKILDVRDFKETAGIILKTLDAGASSSQIASARNFLSSYQNYVGSLRARSGGTAAAARAEVREEESLVELKNALTEIAEGKADGFDLLKPLDIRDYKAAAGLYLRRLEADSSAEKITSAWSFVSAYQKYANSFRRAGLGAPQPALFDFSAIDLRGFEDLKPSEFLRMKGISFESLKGSYVYVRSKENQTTYKITLSEHPNLVVPLALDNMTQQAGIPRIGDMIFFRAERFPKRSEVRDATKIEELQKELQRVFAGEQDKVALFGALNAWDYQGAAQRHMKALGNGASREDIDLAGKFIAFYDGYVAYTRSTNANQSRFRSEARETKPFLGSFSVKVDNKNRISVPSAWRKFLGKNAELMALQEENGQRLRVYTFEAWKHVFIDGGPKDRTQAQKHDDEIFARAVRLKVKPQGRILLSSKTLKSGFLSVSKKFLLAGAGDSFLISPAIEETQSSRSESRAGEEQPSKHKQRNFPFKGLEKIANGEARGIYFLSRTEREHAKVFAKTFLEGVRYNGWKPDPKQIEMAEVFLSSFQSRVNRSENLAKERKEDAAFYFDAAHFRGSEQLTVLEFLEEKGLSVGALEGLTIYVDTGHGIFSWPLSRSLDENLRKIRVKNVSNTDAFWILDEKASSARSEMRDNEAAWTGIATPEERMALRAEINERVETKGAIIYEINARQLRKKFDEITDEELEKIRNLGSNVLWLMGVWRTSEFSAKFNKAWEESEGVGRVASAYAIDDYEVNPDLGDEAALRRLVIRANRKGLKVMLDFVPNHMAADSVWLREHPEWFMQDPRKSVTEVLDLTDYLPAAVLNGEFSSLSFDDAFKAAGLGAVQAFVVFTLGQKFRIAHGREGAHKGSSWADTAQLNISHPGLQAQFKKVLSRILDITNNGGVRVDMAHYTLKEHFNAEWLAPFRKENLARGIWRDMISGLSTQYPGALFLAEAYGESEGILQGAGMDLTYDKYMLDLVLRGADAVPAIMYHLTDENNLKKPSLEYLRRAVHFLENHDDPHDKEKKPTRIANLMSPEQELAALAILAAVTPGAVLLYQGQEERYSHGRPSANWLRSREVEETTDPKFLETHQRLMEVVTSALFRKGEVKGLPAKKLEMSGHVVAVQRKLGDGYALVLVNYSQNMAGIQYVPDVTEWGLTESEAADHEWKDLLTGQRFPLDHNLALKGWEYRILVLRKKKSSLKVVAPPEAEALAATKSPGDKLWEGIHERNPDWQRMNAILEVLLDFERRTDNAVISPHDILGAVTHLTRNQGIGTNDNRLFSLLNRLADLNLIKQEGEGFGLAQPPRVIAVKADAVSYIRKEFGKALEDWTKGEPGAEENLKKIVMDYAQAVALWTLYPIESRWPVLRAVALLDQDDQEHLARFLNEREDVFGANELVDSILLMLKAKPLDGWLKKYAPHLVGRTIYYFSPETVLLAGGLGRVGQFHTTKVRELVGSHAEIALGEPYYHFRLKADNRTEEPLDYSKLPTPVQGLTPLFEFDVPVNRNSVKAKVFSGKNADGTTVYLIDGGEYYTRLLYRYGPDNGWVSYSEFVEFFTRASVETAQRLEKEKQDRKQPNYKAPVLWFNDGQMGPAPVYKAMTDRMTAVLRDALTWFTTHTYRNRGWVDFFQMGFMAPVWARLFGEHDSSSGGVRSADGSNAVSAVHRDEVATHDPFASLFAITNGDDRETSSAVFRAIAKELFPEANVEFLTPRQILDVKRAAKKKLSDEHGWGLNPERIVISYSGRLVPEKAGRSRAFTNKNLRELVKAGAQVLFFGNVQANTQHMFDDLQKLAEEINQHGPGKLIAVTGWGIEDQRKLLAASDLQVQDSDRDLHRGTGAAEYTEADISANAGLQMGPPWLEGIIQKQGMILDRNRPGSGNTLIPNSNNRTSDPRKDEPGAYLEAFQWAIETFNSDRVHFASYQATSLRLSRVLEAVLTGAEYLRQFDRAVRKKDNLKELAKHIRTLAEDAQEMETLRGVFRELTSMKAREAAATFGEEKLPAVMAAVAGLFPQFLERVQSWNPEEYDILSGVISHPELKELFESGTIHFHSLHNRDDDTINEDSLAFSRTFKDKSIVFPIHLGRNTYDHENGKVWLFVKDMKAVIEDPHASFQVSDWSLEKGKKVTYPAQRKGTHFLREWLVGNPVEDLDRDDSGLRQRGKGYQILTLEKIGESGIEPESSARSEARTPLNIDIAQAGVAALGMNLVRGAGPVRSEMREETEAQEPHENLDGIGKESIDGEQLARMLYDAGLPVTALKEGMGPDYMALLIKDHQVIYLAPELDRNYDYGAYENRLIRMATAEIGPALQKVREDEARAHKPRQRKIFVLRGMVAPGTSRVLYNTIKWNAHPASSEDDMDFDLVFQPDFTFREQQNRKEIEPMAVFGLLDDQSKTFQDATREVLSSVYGSFYKDKGIKVQYVNIRSAEMAKEMLLVYLGAKLAHFDDVAELSRAYGADLSAAAFGAGLDKRIRTLFTNPSLGFGGRLFVHLQWIYGQRLYKAAAEMEGEARQGLEARKKSIEEKVRLALKRLESGEAMPGILKDLPPQLHLLFVLKTILRINKQNILDFYNIIEREYEKFTRSSLRGKKVALLSVGYSSQSGQITASPALLLIERLLLDHGISEFYVADPAAEEAFKRWIEHKKKENPRFESVKFHYVDDIYAAVEGADLTIIPADSNKALKSIDIAALGRAASGKPIFDGMNLFGLRADGTSLYKLEDIRKAGIHLFGVGRLPLGPSLDSSTGHRLGDSTVLRTVQDYEQVIAEVDPSKQGSVSFRQKTVTMVGGGYVGLVTAANLAALGHKVHVVDIPSKQKEIDALNSDATAVPIYEPGLREMIVEGKQKGLITFSTDLEPAVRDSSVVYLAVGTPSQETGEVDLSYILKASADVGDVILKHGGSKAIVIKSTVTPDTFERMDETLKAKGLKLGKDYVPVSNPEFLREGQAIEDVTQPDRTVLGFYAALDSEDRKRAEKEMLELWYPLMLKHPHTVLLTDTASSTIIKYLANSFLAISITLSNLFAANADQEAADFMEIKAPLLADPRIGKNAFLAPGAGYGGSCFPKDVLALHFSSRQSTGHELPMISIATGFNDYYKKNLAAKAIRRIAEFPKAENPLKGKRVIMLGMAFKADTDDMRKASSVYVLRELLKKGAGQIVLHDPILSIPNAPAPEVVINHFLDYVFETFQGDAEFRKEFSVHNKVLAAKGEPIIREMEFFKRVYFQDKFLKTGRIVFEKNLEGLGQADIVFLITDWNQYRDISLEAFKKPGRALAVIDGRNLYYARRQELSRLGLYMGIGTAGAVRSEIRGKGIQSVLIVDDNRKSLIRSRLLMRRWAPDGRNLTIQEVSSGEEALALLKELQAQRKLPDLVLTDRLMPGISGPQLAQQIYERNIPVKVILVTGTLSSAEEMRIYNEKLVAAGMLAGIASKDNETEIRRLLDRVAGSLAARSEVRGNGIERVLVVDDSESDRELNEYFLNKWAEAKGKKLKILKAESAEEALGILEAQQAAGEVPDLVLTDRQMPLMSGEMLAKAIHEKGIPAKVILATSVLPDHDTMKDYKETMVDLGVLVGIVKKDSTGETLRPLLDQVEASLTARSEVRTELPFGVQYQDQARVAESTDWFYAQDLDRTFARLATIVRGAKKAKKPALSMTTPDLDVWDMDQFIQTNESLGGGRMKGFEGVTRKLTDGIYSLLATALDSTDLIDGFFSPSAHATEAMGLAATPDSMEDAVRLVAAQRVLGVKTLSAADAFILGPEFALDHGAIAVMRTVFGDMPVVVLVRNDKDRVFINNLNGQLSRANRPDILMADTLAQAKTLMDKEAAKLRGGKVSSFNMKAMVFSSEPLATLLREQIPDITFVTPKMFKNFLSLAGERINSLVQEVQAQFALARSA